jgi:transglutaminase-like putative cysteine protease
MTPSEKTKWEFLRDAPARDALTPELRNVAQHLRAVAFVSPWKSWAFASLAFSVANDLIVYVSDVDRVGREQIDGLTDPQGSTLSSLERGTDDCDAKARIFVALCLAVGISAEMVPLWKGSRLQHVYGRVWVQGPYDTAARWYNAETILARAKLGDERQNVPPEPDTGSWRYSSNLRGKVKGKAA